MSESLEARSRPFIYLIVFFVVGLPLIFPIGLPVKVPQSTVDFYNVIESLPEGSIVLFNYDVESHGWDELASQIIAINKHLYSRPVKVLYTSTMPFGPNFVEKSVEEVSDIINSNDKKVGRDYVNIGYLHGEAAVAAIAFDFHKLISVDFYGNSIEGTFLDEVKDGSDVDLIISADCYGGVTRFINHFYLNYDTTIINGVIGVSIPGALNSLNVGQIKAMLGGIPGGAQYELVTGFKGAGIKQTDAVSSSHIMGLFLILLTNVLLLIRKSGVS